MKKRNWKITKNRMFWISSVLWAGFLILFIYELGITAGLEDTPQVQELEKAANVQVSSPEKTFPREMAKLRIFDAKLENYSDLGREEAAKIGFQELLTSTYYLFVVAGAVLAFVVKLVIEPIIKNEHPEYLNSLLVVGLLTNAALASAVSIVCGFAARAYFSSIGNEKYFSIYREIGISSGAQLAAFFVAAICLVMAVGLIATRSRERMKNIKVAKSSRGET